MGIQLPRHEDIDQTGDRELDSLIRCHYLPFVRIFYRKRIQMVLSLLPSNQIDRLLDAGYGAGLFFPELFRRCRQLHGVDLHPFTVAKRMAERSDLKAHLTRGDLLSLNYTDGSVDAVVSSSVLEHLRALPAALSEIHRVLKGGGIAVLGFPVKNRITKLLFRLIGFDDDTIHPSGHQDILREIPRRFEVEAVRQFPPLVPMNFALYVVVRLRKRNQIRCQ